METKVREAIKAVITALDVPRNRMGKLDGDCLSGEPLRELAVRYGTPGARDNAEQAVNVLRAVLATADPDWSGKTPFAELNAGRESVRGYK